MRLLLLVAAVLAGPVHADDDPALAWHLDGYARLPEAFRTAKAKGVRVLVGLGALPT